VEVNLRQIDAQKNLMALHNRKEQIVTGKAHVQGLDRENVNGGRKLLSATRSLRVPRPSLTSPHLVAEFRMFIGERWPE
jgi:hypothetical protein